MSFEITAEHLSGVLEIATHRISDERGFFEELYSQDLMQDLGLYDGFVQDNHSRSTCGVVRGLHFQHDRPMGKLITVIRGAIQLVELDIRKSSPTFGQHVSLKLTEDDGKLVWIPAGFANGFCATSDIADVTYKCTALYNRDGEGSVNALDPALGIKWAAEVPVLSERDKNAPLFHDFVPTSPF